MGPLSRNDHRKLNEYEPVVTVDETEEEVCEEEYIAPHYERLNSSPDTSTEASSSSRQVLLNFILMSVLFSANHAAMVSVFAFETLNLGRTGAWELSLLSLIYASSSILGATYVVKQLGARSSMVLGMVFYAVYVSCFYLSLQLQIFVNFFSTIGAVMGGLGGGVLWTSQGSYFSRASEDYAACCGNKPKQEATALFAGIFAFIYLLEEVACKLLSWVLLQETSATWTTVAGIYSIIAIISALFMGLVHDYHIPHSEMETDIWYKTTCAWHLLRRNPKMRYMVGLNAVFGFACPFVNAYVNGEVVARVLIKDTNQRFVGLFSALSSAVAALCSLVTGGKSMAKYKGIVLIMGSVSFSMVALPFILSSHFSQWTWSMLAAVYCFQGIGRATFEGTLRSVFADYFPHEREGSYANIILQNGAFTSLGFLLSFYVPCWPQSSHCIEFKDGSLHNMSILEGGIIVVAVVSILGFLQARRIHKIEQAVVQANEEFDLFFPGGHEHGVTGGSESIEAAIRYSCGACG